MIGVKFGRLTIIGDAPHKVFSTGRKTQVTAMCDCGNEGVYVLAALKNGNTKSCGCYSIESKRTHGMYDTRQYQTWADMKTRCDNPKHKWYPEYGGRGIGYVEKWSKFEGFWEDMKEGYSDELTLDRVDNDGEYSKENCRWATPELQSHNQRKARNANNTYFGVRVYDNGKAISRIKMKGKNVNLGTFPSEEIAAKAYDDASFILYLDRPNNTEPSQDEVLEKVTERINGAIEGKSFKPTGSDFCNSVLNEEKALEICKLAHESDMTQKQIGEIFEVDQGVVSAIKRGAAWARATEGYRNSLD